MTRVSEHTKPPHSLAETAALSLPLPVSRLTTIVAAVAAIYLARDVFLPLAMAMLIAFALSPLVMLLRRRGVPHLLAVLAVACAGFIAIALFFTVVVTQVGQLAQDLPKFQTNILAKIDSLQAAGNGGVLSRLMNMLSAVNSSISQALPAAAEGSAIGGVTAGSGPVPVQLVADNGPVALFQNVVVKLLSPVAQVGLVVILVIFMLLEREDLRDKFIRLIDADEMHRTTQMLAEAGERVGQYLLGQLLVNIIYAVPIGIGLWLIGVPHAILWGMLTLVMRFVPFIGAILSAIFPLFLALAVSPDWSAVLWTIALFASVEMITSNVIEPWLYASRTGVSPLAIIVAAIFWTWIWGPMGLVMSTPLTVCLVVLGRHVPYFELFDVLFGGGPVLTPHARLYQRLLAGDVMEATLQAEEGLETAYLGDYYQDVGIPALLLCQDDISRGRMAAGQQADFAAMALELVGDLESNVAEERLPGQDAPNPTSGTGDGYRVSLFGGRGGLDDVAAAMLGQAMAAAGAVVGVQGHADLSPKGLAALDLAGQDCVILTYLQPRSTRAALLHVRRLKQAAPNLRVGVVIWTMPQALTEGDAGSGARSVSSYEPADIGADFVASDMAETFAATFRRDAPLPVTSKLRQRQTGRAAGSDATVMG